MKHILKLVGVGASAGGLDALIDFFKGVPGNCDSAFLVIQHLPADHKSIMAELIAPHANLPVVEAVDGMQLEGGRIYLCPSGMIPRVNELALHLEMRPKGNSFVLPINILFESIGRALGASGAVVILSGTGSDGSDGLRIVEQNGGIVAAQSPETADCASMPQAAISTGKCHIISPPETLWTEIKTYADGKSPKSAAEGPQSENGKESSMIDSEDYAGIFTYLEGLFGLDFSLYRTTSLGRRLDRRMQMLAIPDIKTYLQYLEKNDSEARCLYQDILIGVTDFFRDAESFESLSRKAIKSVMTSELDRDFRIWSAGCATGQEPYSLYILADEVRREVGFTGRITVFATDVFKPSIEFAGKGIYPAKDLSGLSADRLDRYFKKFNSGQYKIHPDVRNNIIFAQHNFLTDTPFTNIDIVSCRNVLIYLKPETQQAAFSAFSFALRDRGFLFLGGSESLGKFESSFKVVCPEANVFQKQSSKLASKYWPGFLARSVNMTPTHVPAPRGSVTINRDLLSAYDSLLNRFAPCGFLINSDYEVLHYFGEAAKFCVNVTGRASLDLAEQLDKHLRLAVTAMLHLVERKNERIATKGIRCDAQDGECLVDVVVEPLRDLHGDVRNFLVEIHTLDAEDDKVAPSAVESLVEGVKVFHADEQFKLLVEELKFTRRNLEVSNEELQISNEELHAVSEEYQASKEELQSTNEELQSTNEELGALNAEYAWRNQELIEINTSYENLLKSTEDGILLVDKEMCIRRFNPAIRAVLNLVPGDVGRPLGDIAYQPEGAKSHSLLDDVRSVLETGERVERELTYSNGVFYMQRITPFCSEEGAIDGALLTFTNFTEARRLEKRFMFALGAAKLSWWDWDLTTGVLEVTSGGSCILGGDCLSSSRDRKGWMELVHPDDQEHVLQTLDDCLEGRTGEWNCEHRFRGDSEQWLWVNNQGLVTRRDSGGKPLEMIGTTQNVDSYKRAVIEARNQQAILEATDEISKVGAWEYDPETKNVFWSSEIRRILEVSEDFVPTAEATYQMMRPEDARRLQEAFEQINIDGTSYDLQLHFMTANGVELLCRSAGRARFNSRGKIVRVVGIFQDITELTTIEQELEAFFNLSPGFKATLAMDGSFKFWNPPWEKQLGYSRDDLLSMNVCDLVAKSDRPAFRRVLDEVTAGSLVGAYETRVISKAGAELGCEAKEVWLSWSFSSESELSLVFASARCVTQEKEAQQALEEARVRAEEASRAKSDFLAVMSHELRTPLNPILGFADMLIEEAKTEEQRDILNTILESGTHMVSLINEILDYSKLDAGKTQVEPVEFSLYDLVQHKVELMAGQIKDGSIKLTRSIDWGPVDESRVPLLVGDVGMIRQVCRNLISNAIKFTKKGSVAFSVSVQKLEGDRVVVRFDVKDSGIGIAKKDLSELFTPFTQVQSGTTREYGGTGLGLAICRRLVNLMDGHISVESKEGEGSTFSFTLPLTLRYAEESGASAEKQVEAQAASPTKKLKGRVLLVEDNESNAFYIKRLIDMYGGAVEFVLNGESALEQLRERAFDLVLLDLHMPGIGGFETLKQIRSSENDSIPVFVLTADASAEAKQDCQLRGADGMLVKPVRPAEIYEVLEKYLEEAD